MSRSPTLLLCALCSSVCSVAAAQAPPAKGPAPTVLWLDIAGPQTADPAATQREKALRLELDARGIVLLGARPPDAAVASEGSAPNPDPSQSAEASAKAMLARTDASAVAWLEGDAERPVSWLRVLRRGHPTVERAPLPHPPAAIEPQLLAVALSGLLDQLLHGDRSTVATPVLEVPAASETPAPPAPAQTSVPEPPLRSPYAVPPRRAEPEPVHEPRWFVRLGLALPMMAVASGMEAASAPPAERVFIEEQVEVDGVQETRFFFDDRLPWVPDADSFDDFEDPSFGVPRGVTPVSSACPADGVETGAGEMPSSFCARVEEPGLVFVPALRLAVGAWLTPELALALAYQLHFGVEPESFLGNQSIGAHGEYLLSGAHDGFAVSLLGAIHAGPSETPVESPGAETINVLSGPLGLRVGVAFRSALGTDLGLVLSPALMLRFPETQWGIGLSATAEMLL